MRILMVTSEVVPFARTGRLADVCGALARALAGRGHDVRVVMPRYRRVARGGLRLSTEPLGVPTGVGERWCLALSTALPGSEATCYFLEHDLLFDRAGLYGEPGARAAFPDNCLRFAVLCRGALQLCHQLGWVPDVIHCWDWQAALVPAFLRAFEARSPLGRVPTVLTIYALASRARFDPREIAVTGLGLEHLDWRTFEHQGTFDPLKGGIALATLVTTASPSYAAEIQTPERGEGLDPLLRHRADRLCGVLDGIDDVAWNPATDPILPARYGADDLGGKAACKAELQRFAGLEPSPERPVLGFVSRLMRQKGAPLVVEAADRLVGLGAQLVVQGTGTPEIEEELRNLSVRFPRSLAWLEVSEPLVHLIGAGADLLLVPRLSEPWGGPALYPMRYGTLPVVLDAGGLRDAVVGESDGEAEPRGFTMAAPTADALVETVRRAVETRAAHPDRFAAMVRRAMALRSGWRDVAGRYEELYREADGLAAS